MHKLVRELQALEAELHHPGVRCSRERLEELLHPDFHEVGRSGRQYAPAGRSRNAPGASVVDLAACGCGLAAGLPPGDSGFRAIVRATAAHACAAQKTVQTNGFAPISGQHAKVLILGTLPGQASLLKNEYYGQPRNVFWRIMGELFGAAPDLPYEERKRRIIAANVALWDVCAAAHRPGSLDTAIDSASVVANDFAVFLGSHPAVRLICFNGLKSEALYRRLVRPKLPEELIVRYHALPSTSPANASMPYDEKLRRWSVVRTECQGP